MKDEGRERWSEEGGGLPDAGLTELPARHWLPHQC